MTAPRTIAALDVPVATLDARLAAGRLAEQRHQYADLDADSACRVLVKAVAK